METTLAHQTNMIDKYLMGELTHEERLGFEEHLFDCPACAAKVKEDFAIIANLKEVLLEQPRPAAAPRHARAETNGGWLAWLRLPTFVPACAAVALAALAGYQNFVSIPRMLRPQVIDTVPIVAATRGTNTQTVVAQPGTALFAASFEVFSQDVYSGLACEFLDAGRHSVATIDCGKHTGGEFTLSLLLPVGKFPPGGYTMVLRPASVKQTEIGRYSFIVKSQDKLINNGSPSAN